MGSFFTEKETEFLPQTQISVLSCAFAIKYMNIKDDI